MGRIKLHGHYKIQTGEIVPEMTLTGMIRRHLKTLNLL